MVEDTKKCKLCLATKSINEFKPDKRMRGGRYNFCRTCCKDRYLVCEKRYATSEKRREWNRRYCSEISSKKAGRMEKNRDTARKQKQLYPHKYMARMTVRKAINAGELIRPELCSMCGAGPNNGYGRRHRIQAHHDDYSKPLDVKWVCSICHKSLHDAALEEKS